jgi:hypothetical protein
VAGAAVDSLRERQDTLRDFNGVGAGGFRRVEWGPGMAGGTFRLADIHHVVDAVSRSAQYPLADAAALETALGGGSATVALGAEKHQASEVRQIPADYFPIESADDLFTKLASLRGAGGDQAEGMQAGQHKPLSSLPPEAGSRPPAPPGGISPGRNAPSVKGYPR